MANGLIHRLREAVSASAAPQLQREEHPHYTGDEPIRERDFTADEREKAGKEGAAFPDGSYPVYNQQDADNAWGLRGRSKSHSEASVVAHIRSRVKALGLKMPGSDSAREAAALRLVLREAAPAKKGNAYEVTVVREGPGNAADRNYYTRDALREAVRKGLFEGLQAYLNHPTASEERDRPERDVRYLAGHFREARFVDGNPAEVRAKFIPGGMDTDGVIQLIESALQSVPGRPLIGISIDGYGHAPDQQDINGRTYNMVREVTHLGSADIVTRAGAGGQFHRRLQEAWRNPGPERRPDTPSEEVHMKPARMQEAIKAAARKLTEAADIKDDDEKAGSLIEEALTSLRECADADLETEVKIKETRVEVPVAAGDSKADELAVKLQEAEAAVKAEKKARKNAEEERDTVRAHVLANKVLREAKVSDKTARSWFDDVTECENEDAMRRLVERKVAEREELFEEFREAAGIEGAGRRESIPAAPAPAAGGLLGAVGIDPDEIPAA